MTLRSKRVLVVDDHTDVADTLAGILQLRGYDAVAVYSAEEALTLGEARCPEAVITEVFMQRMGDGIQLAIKLAEAFPTCKVILISSNLPKASRLLTGHQFPLLRMPIYPADIVPFVCAVDAILLPPVSVRPDIRG